MSLNPPSKKWRHIYLKYRDIPPFVNNFLGTAVRLIASLLLLKINSLYSEVAQVVAILAFEFLRGCDGIPRKEMRTLQPVAALVEIGRNRLPAKRCYRVQEISRIRYHQGNLPCRLHQTGSFCSSVNCFFCS